MVTHCAYSESSYIPLSDVCHIKICEKLWKHELNSDFFHFYFLNMDISVTIQGFELKFSV